MRIKEYSKMEKKRGLVSWFKNSVDIDERFLETAERSNPDLIRSILSRAFLYSIVGLVLGLISILIGAIFIANGITGNTSWTATVLGLESHLSDATPGVIFAIVGLLLIYVTRFKFRGVSKAMK